MSNRDSGPRAQTLAVRETCLCFHLQRAARKVARRFDEALRPLGLTSGQFSLLMALDRAEPASLGRIAGALAMDRTTLTANVKPLARRGLVKVSADAADRRRRCLWLTPAGRAVLAASMPIWRRAHAAVEGLLGRSDMDRLRADLRALS